MHISTWWGIFCSKFWWFYFSQALISLYVFVLSNCFSNYVASESKIIQSGDSQVMAPMTLTSCLLDIRIPYFLWSLNQISGLQNISNGLKVCRSSSSLCLREFCIWVFPVKMALLLPWSQYIHFWHNTLICYLAELVMKALMAPRCFLRQPRGFSEYRWVQDWGDMAFWW